MGRTHRAACAPRRRARLRAYAWPGNVRELQNVIERAVITSIAGRLAVRRFLPQLSTAVVPPSNPIRTAHELEQLERDSILAALEAAAWKIAGDGGAAERLGTKPSTLRSRMSALKISRPG